MLIDFHCHTRLSHDGFTTYKELLIACNKKNISAISITEHDKLDPFIESYFKKTELNVIKGCEFTTNLGAHIIGLFINNATPENNDIYTIIKYIISQNGLILVPHPYKETSGVLKVYEEYSFLENCHLIEIVNGGINRTKKEINELISYAKKYDLKMVSGSDSHKVDQIGYYVNYYKDSSEDLYNTIKKQDPIIYFDSSFKSAPRKIYNFQKMHIYQVLLKLLSPKIRRWIKLYFNIIFKSQVNIKKPIYKKLDLKHE